jgi:hypothetical protein
MSGGLIGNASNRGKWRFLCPSCLDSRQDLTTDREVYGAEVSIVRRPPRRIPVHIGAVPGDKGAPNIWGFLNCWHLRRHRPHHRWQRVAEPRCTCRQAPCARWLPRNRPARPCRAFCGACRATVAVCAAPASLQSVCKTQGKIRWKTRVAVRFHADGGNAVRTCSEGLR